MYVGLVLEGGSGISVIFGGIDQRTVCRPFSYTRHWLSPPSCSLFEQPSSVLRHYEATALKPWKEGVGIAAFEVSIVFSMLTVPTFLHTYINNTVSVKQNKLNYYIRVFWQHVSAPIGSTEGPSRIRFKIK